MKKTLFTIIPLLLLILTSHIYASEGESPKTEKKAATRTNKDPKKEMGRQFLMAVKNQLKFSQEQEIITLVSKVGRELVKAAGSDPKEYHFFVIKGDEINAFAVPGGYIFIYEGLLKNVDNIGALAGVLAHEIAHVERDHLFKDSKMTGLVDLATLAAIILGSSSNNGGSTMATAQAANISYKLKMSREHEEDADIFAIRYLKQSSYHPSGLIELFKALAHYGRLNSADMIPTYLSTHPGAPDRRMMVETMLKDIPDEKPLAFDWARVVTILKAGEKRRSAYEPPDDKNKSNKERTHYLKGLFAFKSNRTNEAKEQYKKALSLNPKSAIYHADLSAIYLRRKEYDLAKKEALKSIGLSKKNAAPYFVMAMLAKKAEKNQEALDYFSKVLELTPEDPFTHYHMAGLYYSQKKPYLMRLHLARHYRFNLNTEEALRQYQMAMDETRSGKDKEKITLEIKDVKRNGI